LWIVGEGDGEKGGPRGWVDDRCFLDLVEMADVAVDGE